MDKKYFNIVFSKCIGHGGSKSCHKVIELESVNKDLFDLSQISLLNSDYQQIKDKSLVLLQMTKIKSYESMNKEIKIQQELSKYGIAPYITNIIKYKGGDWVLSVSCGKSLSDWGCEKLFEFDYEGVQHYHKLIHLFSTLYKKGYIFADSTPNNICWDDSQEKFLLIDFDPLFCYKHNNIISEEVAIRFTLLVTLFYWIIHSENLKRADTIKYIKEIESIADAHLGLDSKELNLDLNMDIEIGAKGGIWEEIQTQQELFSRNLDTYVQTLSRNFIYYTVGKNIPMSNYFHLNLSEFLLLRYEENKSVSSKLITPSQRNSPKRNSPKRNSPKRNSPKRKPTKRTSPTDRTSTARRTSTTRRTSTARRTGPARRTSTARRNGPARRTGLRSSIRTKNR